MKVFKFYVLIMTIFWEKGGIVFKGGHYSRKYGKQKKRVHNAKFNTNSRVQAVHTSYVSIYIKSNILYGFGKLKPVWLV